MANVLSKAKDVYDKTAPYHGAMKEAGRAAMGAMRGSAMTGGDATGGAMSGGAMSGRKKMSARLM
jgi:hypothetical protein